MNDHNLRPSVMIELRERCLVHALACPDVAAHRAADTAQMFVDFITGTPQALGDVDRRTEFYDATLSAFYSSRISAGMTTDFRIFADDLLKMACEMNDWPRAKEVLRRGRGSTPQEFWKRGAETAAYLLDGTLPVSSSDSAETQGSC